MGKRENGKTQKKVMKKREKNGKTIFKIKGKITTIHSIFIRLITFYYFITFQEGKGALGELTILSLFI
jgi:hypothetical protein